MMNLGLQARITLLSSIVVALGIVLCGAGAAIFLRHQRVAELDRELAAEARHFLDELERHGGPKFDWKRNKSGPREWSSASHLPRFLEIVDDGGQVLHRTPGMPDQKVEGRSPGFRDVRLNGAPMRLGTFPERGITLRIFSSYQPIDQSTRDLLIAFGFAAPIVLLFVFLGGRWIARQAVAPIQEITASAERITTKHLDQRLPIPQVRDEIHRLATVLNRTLDRLDQGFQQATRFTADASHELKTPLTVLRTSIETLMRSPDLPSAGQRAVVGLLEQTNRLSAITTSLLLLSRADVGKLFLDLVPGNLSKIVELCMEDARIVAHAKGIEIDVEIPTAAPAMVDPARTAQIIMNVIDNAIKFNEPDGKVRIGLLERDGWWELKISNTGFGISAGNALHLFTRFYRGEHTANIAGHGLGLSLSRELARAHRGDLVFGESSEGWTTFVFRVPALTNLSKGLG